MQRDSGAEASEVEEEGEGEPEVASPPPGASPLHQLSDLPSDLDLSGAFGGGAGRASYSSLEDEGEEQEETPTAGADRYSWEALAPLLSPDSLPHLQLLRRRPSQVLRQVVDRAHAEAGRQLTPARVLLRDKVAFTLGTLDLLVSGYWLGAWPSSFYKLYTAKAAVLFSLRLAIYWHRKWNYYLLDFCYYGQALLLAQVWFFPDSIRLVKVTFALNMGPLLWSIVAFRNSLVFHSLDMLTSHFLHLYPACVSWSQRWAPPPALAARLAASPKDGAAWEAAAFWELALLPMAPYALWVVAYYIKVFVVSSQKIQDRGYATLFKHLTSSRRSLFGAVVLRFPQAWQPVVYMAMHAALCFAALLLNAVWWGSRAANTACLLGVFAASAWNGATYYFDWFAHKYVDRVGLPRRRLHSNGSDSKGGKAA